MKKVFLVVLTVFLLMGNAAFALEIQGHDYELLTNVDPFSASAPAYSPGTDLGYFLWSDASRRNWSLRWSGDALINLGAGYNFTGNIVLSDNTFSNVSEILFESNQVDMFSLNFDTNNIFQFGFVNTHEDGIDFSIIGDITPSYIGFDLNIQALTSTSTDVSPNNAFIFIGNDMLNPVSGDFAMAAPVPEPGTLLLLGSGLIGLAYLKRRKS